MKAITPVIGIIILLLIVVALAGSAYSFLLGIFGFYSDKTIKIVPYSEDEYKVTIQNLGTTAFNTSEITISVDGDQAQLFNPQIVQSKEAATLEFFPPSIGDNKQIRLAGPTNSITYRTDMTFFPLFSCDQDDVGPFWEEEKTYIVVKDLVKSSSGQYCFNINSDNVTIDCKGKKISNTTYGFENNVQFYTVVKNCHVEASEVGIFLTGRESTLENNIWNISGPSALRGIFFGNTASGNTLINNDLCSGTGDGRNITIVGASVTPKFGSGNRCPVDACEESGSSIVCKDMGWGNPGDNDCDFNCTG